VHVVGSIFKEETYGIALPTGCPLCKPINEAAAEADAGRRLRGELH
jgi:hypothetical protein